MQSRRDDVDFAATIERARALGLCGFGGPREPSDERLTRRIDRFRDVEDGSFVWTHDSDGLYWLGRITGPYFYDADDEAVAVDLVHVCECRWLATPFLEPKAPAAVVGTFRRGGRNFQQIHDATVGAETERLWEDVT